MPSYHSHAFVVLRKEQVVAIHKNNGLDHLMTVTSPLAVSLMMLDGVCGLCS